MNLGSDRALYLLPSDHRDRLTASLGRQVAEDAGRFQVVGRQAAKRLARLAGEESAGATFLRRDGSAWTTDKDGIAAALLSAEITAHTGCDPASGMWLWPTSSAARRHAGWRPL